MTMRAERPDVTERPPANEAAPVRNAQLKPWRTPVVILETVSSETAQSSHAGSDTSHVPLTNS